MSGIVSIHGTSTCGGKQNVYPKKGDVLIINHLLRNNITETDPTGNCVFTYHCVCVVRDAIILHELNKNIHSSLNVHNCMPNVKI